MFATTTSPPIDPGNVEAKLSCSNSLLFTLDGLAMNLEKGYRPAGDLIIEDADYQPTGIPSLCIEVCPTFYRDWTIPEMVMPVHDMSRSVAALIGALVALGFAQLEVPERASGWRCRNFMWAPLEPRL